MIKNSQTLIDHGLVSKDSVIFPKTPDIMRGNFFEVKPQRNYPRCFPKKILPIGFIHIDCGGYLHSHFSGFQVLSILVFRIGLRNCCKANSAEDSELIVKPTSFAIRLNDGAQFLGGGDTFNGTDVEPLFLKVALSEFCSFRLENSSISARSRMSTRSFTLELLPDL